MEEKIITQAFNISPANIYGLLVVVLLFTIFVQGIVIRHLYIKFSDMFNQNLVAIKENTVAMHEFRDAVKDLTDPERNRLQNIEFTNILADVIDEKLKPIFKLLFHSKAS